MSRAVVPLSRYREVLGAEVAHLSDAELAERQRRMQQLAEVVLSTALERYAESRRQGSRMDPVMTSKAS